MKKIFFFLVIVITQIRAFSQDIAVNISVVPTSIPASTATTISYGEIVVKMDNISDNPAGNYRVLLTISLPGNGNTSFDNSVALISSDLPAGWTIPFIASDGQSLKISNGTDPFPGVTSHTFHLKYKAGTTTASAGTVSARITWANGTAPGTSLGSQPAEDANPNTAYNNSSDATITVSGALPVQFVKIDATLLANDLQVNWITQTEKNNEKFIIEASLDGKNFKEIGTVNSQSVNGNSDKELSYSFQAKLTDQILRLSLDKIAMLFIGLLAIALLTKVSRKKPSFNIFTILIVAGIIGISAYSCRKNNKDGLTPIRYEKVYVRVIEVDNTGSKFSSKIVTAVNN